MGYFAHYLMPILSNYPLIYMLKFENPDLLHLLWALLLHALLLLVYWQWRRRTLRQLGSNELAGRLLLGFSNRRFWLKNVLFASILTLTVLALANPQRPVSQILPEQMSADVLIALDISESMLATDVSPSRLKKSKSFIQDLVQKLAGERVGLIFFAGEAVLQMPLSTDFSALLTFVSNASPDLMTEQSTDLAAPIEVASHFFGTNPEAGCALVLISDGEQHEGDPVLAAKKAHDLGLILHTVAVGTAAGGPIPMAGGGKKRDPAGRVVTTFANENLLKNLAQAGGGSSLKMDGPNVAETIAREVDRLQKKAVRAETGVVQESQYQWLVGLALLLLIVDQLFWWRRKI